MQIYVLDDKWRRIHLIDRFESLVWTDRYNTAGDFELKVPDTPEFRSILKTNVDLHMDESDRIMTINVFETGFDDDGKRFIVVKGYSYEHRFKDRWALHSYASKDNTPVWFVTGRPGAVARQVVRNIIFDGQFVPWDTMAEELQAVVPGSPRLAEPEQTIRYEVQPQTLYDFLVGICQEYDLGWRIRHLPNEEKLTFSVYTGRDRTATQSTSPAVVFSPDLENLENARYVETNNDAKTVIYVQSKTRITHVYQQNLVDDGTTTTRGFERKILYLSVDNVPEGLTNAEIDEFLKQKGLEELARHRITQVFDGQISEWSQYRYRTDYNLGDLVELRNQQGHTSVMMVTEQVFVADSGGARRYPTLTFYRYIQPGSWASWAPLKTWSNMTTEEWAGLP